VRVATQAYLGRRRPDTVGASLLCRDSSLEFGMRAINAESKRQLRSESAKNGSWKGS
jgi:hypothetical protein